MTDNPALLIWKQSSNGFVQIADSTITTPDGGDLRWYLGGDGGVWGLTLAKEGQPAVKRIFNSGSAQAAKDAAQQFESDNAWQTVRFPRFEVLERYHLAGGEAVTIVAGIRTEPATLGELEADYARRAAKTLTRAQKKGRTLRLFTDDGGVALVVASQVTHVTVFQRDDDCVRVKAEPTSI